MRTYFVGAALAAALLVPEVVQGQEPTRRRQAPITIRGQVPTPQVVTVRPRDVPSYARNILVPTFYDRDFWVVILPAYQLVPVRMITSQADSLLGADASGVTTARAAAPLDALGLPPLPPRPSQPFGRQADAAPVPMPAAPAADSTGRAPGTASANPQQ